MNGFLKKWEHKKKQDQQPWIKTSKIAVSQN